MLDRSYEHRHVSGDGLACQTMYTAYIGANFHRTIFSLISRMSLYIRENSIANIW